MQVENSTLTYISILTLDIIEMQQRVRKIVIFEI